MVPELPKKKCIDCRFYPGNCDFWNPNSHKDGDYPPDAYRIHNCPDFKEKT